mmetsp:Transcript_10431/g.25650  ORF Transcript_10431/g.25650 Transcript_10431/m.25650 type:complete len:87 (+) Transcript_10431:1181-1441(+)
MGDEPAEAPGRSGEPSAKWTVDFIAYGFASFGDCDPSNPAAPDFLKRNATPRRTGGASNDMMTRHQRTLAIPLGLRTNWLCSMMAT